MFWEPGFLIKYNSLTYLFGSSLLMIQAPDRTLNANQLKKQRHLRHHQHRRRQTSPRHYLMLWMFHARDQCRGTLFICSTYRWRLFMETWNYAEGMFSSPFPREQYLRSDSAFLRWGSSSVWQSAHSLDINIFVLNPQPRSVLLISPLAACLD